MIHDSGIVFLTVFCVKPAGENMKSFEMDYLVLVNKENRIPDHWEENLETVCFINSQDEEVEVEKCAYEHCLKLKEALEKEGILVDLDSAWRSVSLQQEIMDRFCEESGEDYVQRFVAAPGYSEHHTGLALDLYLIIEGNAEYYDEEMTQYAGMWKAIHEKLTDYGFIIRYPEGKESITGYSYEPWHIRYVGSAKTAEEIMRKGLTLEEYLNRLPATDVTPPSM